MTDIGLCHSVQNTAELLAREHAVPLNESGAGRQEMTSGVG